MPKSRSLKIPGEPGARGGLVLRRAPSARANRASHGPAGAVLGPGEFGGDRLHRRRHRGQRRRRVLPDRLDLELSTLERDAAVRPPPHQRPDRAAGPSGRHRRLQLPRGAGARHGARRPARRRRAHLRHLLLRRRSRRSRGARDADAQRAGGVRLPGRQRADRQRRLERHRHGRPVQRVLAGRHLRDAQRRQLPRHRHRGRGHHRGLGFQRDRQGRSRERVPRAR